MKRFFINFIILIVMISCNRNGRYDWGETDPETDRLLSCFLQSWQEGADVSELDLIADSVMTAAKMCYRPDLRKEAMARALYVRSRKLNEAGRKTEGKHVLAKAMKLQDSIKWPFAHECMKLLHNVYLYSESGNTPEIYEKFEKSRLYFHKTGNRLQEGDAATYLGIILHEIGDLTGADYFFNIADECYSKANANKYKMKNSLNLVSNRLQMEDTVRSAKLLENLLANPDLNSGNYSGMSGHDVPH